jgi:hypothetical protein
VASSLAVEGWLLGSLDGRLGDALADGRRRKRWDLRFEDDMAVVLFNSDQDERLGLRCVTAT